MGKVLIPLLNNNEEENAFLEAASGGITEAVLVLVIDTGAMTGKFGFAASQIAHGNETIGKCKSVLAARGIQVEDVEEWGDTFSKINTVAKLKRIRDITVKNQDNHYFKNLVKMLRAENYEVKVI
jgi:hypothetical protein